MSKWGTSTVNTLKILQVHMISASYCCIWTGYIVLGYQVTYLLNKTGTLHQNMSRVTRHVE
jgi:hypothetical protein